jgi:enoyl-CoA hydratase/carnithine racemase
VDNQTYRTLRYQEIGYCRSVDLPGALDKNAGEFLFVELAEVCDRIAWDDNARVVVLVFDKELKLPPHFECFQNSNPEKSSFANSVAKLKQPVIAAIGGDAIGLGLELALACDIRIGTANARFGFPQIRRGRIPSNGGTQRLPRLIGYPKAMEMILTGDLIDAEEAERLGLLNRVTSPDTLMETTMKMAQEMAEKSPLSLIYAKEALYGGRDLTLDQGLRMELDLYLLLFQTSDRTEGIKAFREKRKPGFKGA